MAAKIELIISGDNTGAVNALRGLANVVVNVNNTINNVNNGINNFNSQINNFANGGKNASESADRFGSSLLNLSVIAGTAYMAIIKIKDALTSLIKPGMDFQSTVETGRLGVAGILMSMTQVNGQSWQLPQALKQADKYMEDVIIKARKWRLSVDDVLEAYQGLFAPGLRGGMNPEQIAEYAAVMTKTAYAFNLPKIQILQESRAMLTGDIDQNATIAKSLGITPADIERAKQSSEGLFAFLMNKLSGFKAVAEVYSDTLPGKIKQIKDAFTQASSEGFKPFYEFGKTVLDDLANRILVIDKNTKEIKGVNPDLLSSLNSLSSAVISIVKSLLDIGGQAGPVLVSALRGVADILQVVAKHGREVFNVIASLFIASQLSALFGGGAAAAGKLFSVLKTIAEVISTIGRMVSIVFAGTMANGIAGAITAMGRLITVLKSANTALKAMQLLSALKNPILFAGTLAAIANIDTIIEKTESFFGKRKEDATDWNPEGKPSRPNRDEEDAAIARGEKEKAAQITLKENREAWDLIKSRYDIRIAAIKAQSDADQKEVQRLIQQQDEKQQADLKMGLPGNPYHQQNKSVLEQKILKIQLQAKQDERDELGNLIAIGDNQQKQSEVNPFRSQLNTLDAAIAELSVSLGVSAKEFNEMNEITELFKGSMANLQRSSSTTKPGEGQDKTWSREVPNVNIEGLKPNALSAIDALGEWFQKETGKKMTVSSGLRDWGGHVSGSKFDVVDDSVSTDLEENKNDIRNRMIAYAKSIGLKVLDEYADPSARATAGHLDFSADDFTATSSGNQFEQANATADQLREALKKKSFSTAGAVKLLDEAKSLIDEASKLDQEMLNLQGNAAAAMRKQLEPQKNALVDKFNTWGMPDYAEKAQNVFDRNMLKADFSQSQKNIDIANGELVTTQKNLMNDLAKGTKTAAQITQEYTDAYNTKVKSEVAKMEQQLADAIKNDDKDLANHIRAELRKIPEAINDFAEKIIQKINSDLQADINRINADRSLTTMQKKDAIEELQRKAYSDTADEQELQAKVLRDMPENKKEDSRKRGIDPDVTAAALEQQANLNRQLAQTPSLLDKIHESSKQAFEDGLLTFLTTGITECKNLGEAFRNLAISVLQSIQKVYAEAMNKNIMSMLGFGPQTSRPMIEGNAVQGPLRVNGKFADGGDVQGPGTGTSDSILAKLSNGEFVIKAASVLKYGKNFLHRLNNGFVPTNLTPRFATGGLVGASADGASGIASSIQGGDVSVPLKVVNITDPNEVGRYLKTKPGERVMVNFMKNNAGTMRQILNIRG